ncbi:hypothetical protein LTR47_009843 [Exophiala xenobiotica]|nr:hypothetical protein LTR47_009843 [Exophiala xenobiotica]KAK5348001.1 hypothetical protein LTR61_008253 [Exophiala xenobiotica]KAK5361390.1 hypothetical protein LTS03_010343 [Exophiala xenobiotica]KAK5378693.1 hypothetical protein LTR11_004388 [Exophiala xenobiotica]
MEALAAFSLACNIVQVLDFSLKIFREGKQIADSGSTAKLDEFTLVSKQLEDLCKDLDKSLQNAPKPISKNDDNLLKVAQDCSRAAHDVQAKLGEIMMNKKGGRSKLDKLRKMVTSSRSVTALYNKLREYEKLLNTQILVQLSRRQEDIHLLQQSSSEQVDLQLRAFLARLSEGVTEISELVTKCHEETRELLVTQHLAVEQSLARQTTTLNELSLNEHTISRQLIRDNNSATQNLLQSTFHDLQSASVAAQSRERLLASLYYPEIWHRRDQIVSVHTNTYQWIFEENDDDSRPWHCFTTWLKSQGSYYWISGKPGSGKSTLMNFISKDKRTRQFLRQWCATEPLVLSFFFWKAGSPLQRSAQGLLRSLLYQLLRTNDGVADELLRGDNELRLRTPNSAWSELSLERLLDTALGLLSSEALFVVVDGLDEMQGEDGGFDLKMLLIYLNDISSRSNIKICFSSRPGNPMSSTFVDIPQLRLQDLTRKDMHHYVEDLLMAHNDVRHIERQRLEELAANLTSRADGVFLWVALATKSLLRGLENHDTMEELEARLTKLPSGLENLYLAMWSSLGEDERLYRTEAANLLKIALLHQEIFAWRLSLFTLVVALEPDLVGTVLTTGKLPTLRRLVVACERMEKRLPVVCASLLEVCFVNTEDRRVRADAENIPTSLRLLRQNGDWSEDQEADWNLLHVMHNRRRVDFVHRSAIDFLRDTVTGREILGYAALTDLEIYKRALEANFAAYAMRYSSLRMCDLSSLIQSVQTFDDGHQSSDILQLLHDHTMRVIALPEQPFIITDGDWLANPSNRSRQYRGFLGLVITELPRIGQRNIFESSRWAFTTMKESDQSYKNYLLACAVKREGVGTGNSVEILLQHGADPHSSSKLQRDAPAPQSTWSIALESCLHAYTIKARESRARTTEILQAFLNHHVDLDEAVVQQRYAENDWEGYWTDIHLQNYMIRLRRHIIRVGVPFIRGIKASDVVDFLRNADDTATPEGKDSDLSAEIFWRESTVDALPWRYVAHDCELGFLLVGGRADMEKFLQRAWAPAVEREQGYASLDVMKTRDALRAAVVELSTPISGEEFLKYLYFRPEQTPDFQQELLAGSKQQRKISSAGWEGVGDTSSDSTMTVKKQESRIES